MNRHQRRAARATGDEPIALLKFELEQHDAPVPCSKESGVWAVTLSPMGMVRDAPERFAILHVSRPDGSGRISFGIGEKLSTPALKRRYSETIARNSLDSSTIRRDPQGCSDNGDPS